MKTTLLILFSTCLGLLAQTPSATDDGSDPALRDAILRAIVRGGSASNGSAVTAAPTPPPAPAVPASVAPAPVTPVPAAPPAFAPDATFARQAAVPPPAAPVGSAVPVAATLAPGPFDTAPVVAANPSEPADKEVDFPGIDLNTFLDTYAGLVGRTVLRPTTLSAPPLTLKTQKPITQTELIQAMSTVLAMNGISLVDEGSNFVKAETTADGLVAGGKFSTTPGQDLPDAEQFVAQIVTLKYMKPSDMVSVLQPFSKTQNLIPIGDSQILIIRDYADNVKRMLELISQVDVETQSEFQTERIPIKYAEAEDIANALSSLGGSTTTGIPRSTGSVGGRAGGAGGVGGIGGGQPGYPGGQLGTLGGGSPSPLGATSSSAPNASFAQRLRQAVAGATGGSSSDFKLFTGVTKIMPDARSNSLLVFANDTDMKMVKRIVSQLDVILPQVLIEAIIMEVNLDDERNLGVSYLQQNPTQSGKFTGVGALNNGTFLTGNNFINNGTNGAAGLASGLSYAAAFGNDFDATLTAIATDSRIKVLSRPRIQTSHGVAAELQVGDTIPYITATYDSALNGGVGSSQYSQTFVGIDLQVTPLINSDGLVVMDINQDIEQLGPATTINGNAVPSTTKRSAKATVSVMDRDTIILGGFISSTKSKSNSGVPILKDIPVAGALFRSSSDSLQRVELIVLIRPTVLPTPGAAALAATHERDRLPLVKAAQKEYQIDENRLLKEADKIRVPNEGE